MSDEEQFAKVVPKAESAPQPEIVPAGPQAEADQVHEPDAPEPPPLAESLVALGLIVIVAWSCWLWFAPAIRAMWRASIHRI